MSDHKEQVVIAAAGKATKLGVGTTGVSAGANYSGLAKLVVDNSELITTVGVIIGTGLAILGFAISTIMQIRRDRREARESQRKVGS